MRKTCIECARGIITQYGRVIAERILLAANPHRFRDFEISFSLRVPLNRVATLSRYTRLFVASQKHPWQISLITRGSPRTFRYLITRSRIIKRTIFHALQKFESRLTRRVRIGILFVNLRLAVYIILNISPQRENHLYCKTVFIVISR